MIGSSHWDNEILQFSGSSLLWSSWEWVPSTILSFPYLLEEYQVKIRSLWEQMWLHEDFPVPNKWGKLALASSFVPSDWLVILKIKRKALPVVTTIVDQKEYDKWQLLYCQFDCQNNYIYIYILWINHIFSWITLDTQLSMVSIHFAMHFTKPTKFWLSTTCHILVN